MTTRWGAIRLGSKGKPLLAILLTLGLAALLAAPALARGQGGGGRDRSEPRASSPSRTSSEARPEHRAPSGGGSAAVSGPRRPADTNSGARAPDPSPPKRWSYDVPEPRRALDINWGSLPWAPRGDRPRSDDSPRPPRESYRPPSLIDSSPGKLYSLPVRPMGLPGWATGGGTRPPKDYAPPGRGTLPDDDRPSPPPAWTRGTRSGDPPPSRGPGGPGYNKPGEPRDKTPDPPGVKDRKPPSSGGGVLPRDPDDRVSPRPGGTKKPYPPADYRPPSRRVRLPYPWRGYRPPVARAWIPPRVSFRAPGAWRYSYRPWWRYHHYYYTSWPCGFYWGGWGAGWYDPWWSGPYWWPRDEIVIVNHYDYHYDVDDEAERPRDEGSEWRNAAWMEPALQTAMDDVATLWTTGTIEKLQAHLTPTLGISLRHDWEQEEPWVLAPAVLLDIVLQAVDAQRDSTFRFVQAEQMEPGLVWAVGEQTYTTDTGERVEASMEIMFRRYDDTWLVEAITADPAQYWWMAKDLLADAATESARLFDQMEQAREKAPEEKPAEDANEEAAPPEGG
jgi:hypothetical protein